MIFSFYSHLKVRYHLSQIRNSDDIQFGLVLLLFLEMFHL